MPRITAEEIKERRRDVVEEAGQTFDQMLGADAQNGLVTFEQPEERACVLRDAFTRTRLHEHRTPMKIGRASCRERVCNGV